MSLKQVLGLKVNKFIMLITVNTEYENVHKIFSFLGAFT